MRKDVMQDVAQLSQFDDELYKVGTLFILFFAFLFLLMSIHILGDWKRK